MKDYRTIIGSDFAIGDKVIIDDDTSLKGVVTAFLYRGDINNEVDSAEVSWIHNGASYTVWMQPWRLTKV